MFSINMERAKNIHRENIRKARKEALEKLDVQYMRALESNNSEKIAEIVNIKQQLRDLPNCEAIQNAVSPDDLKNHWPSILACESPYH